MSAPTLPADLAADCLNGSVRRLIGGVHSWTAARVVVACVEADWVRVRFSSDPGRLPAPWEVDEQQGWWRTGRDAEPGLRDASADPVLIVVGVGEHHLIAVNLLAIDEIGVTCRDGEELLGSWVMQVHVQGCPADTASLAGVKVSDNPDATVVVADPLVGESAGWVDVLTVGTSWPVRPLRRVRHDPPPAVSAVQSLSGDDRDENRDGALVDEGERDLGGKDPATGGRRQEDCRTTRAGAYIKVFGDFEITDTDGMALQPVQQQIIGMIAMCGPIPRSELCQQVYGTERQKSFHVAMSKVRRRGLVPELTEQGYRIDIDSQWRRFTDLVGPDPAGADTAALARAAAMVATPLFGANPPQWTLKVVPAMVELIGQVCRELAARHADAPKVAWSYAQLGLSVDPGHPELTEIAEMLKAGPQDLGEHEAGAQASE